ncbi:MAG: hypothetical protein ACT4PJ_03155 [Gemmatimonadaceae bacterium]
MKIRIVDLGGGRLSRGKTIALAIAALAIGGIFLALGVALLATLAVAGTLIGVGMAIARLVKGGGSLPPRRRDLDPTMEVFPPDDAGLRRIEGERESR